jgi:UTP--glucose-1-phosphate uridylyltransferase
VQRVPMEEVHRYGIVKPLSSDGRLHEVETLVEKPSQEEAPSNLAIIGRYLLTPTIFGLLEMQEPGAGGEIQLTDAIEVLNHQERVFAYEFEGKRYDVGEVSGFVKTTIDFALQNPELRDEIYEYLRGLMQPEIV